MSVPFVSVIIASYNGARYLHGEQPYRPPTELPFRSLVYPPAHEMSLAAVFAVFGPSLEPAPPEGDAGQDDRQGHGRPGAPRPFPLGG